MDVFSLPAVERIVDLALAEDLGRGDLTTRLTVPAERRAYAEIVAKQEGVLAGVPLVRKVYERLGDSEVSVKEELADGEMFVPGSTVVSLSGSAATVLSGERVVLNFLQLLSGVATLTQRYVAAVAGTSARIVDTRKTTPGMRVLEKYAVRVGGACNHRTGLFDGVLIKDNHIKACGGIEEAVSRIKERVSHLVKIEVEVSNKTEVEEALEAGADVIMLDNMDLGEIRESVELIDGKAIVEVSGMVTKKDLVDNTVKARYYCIEALRHVLASFRRDPAINPDINLKKHVSSGQLGWML